MKTFFTSILILLIGASASFAQCVPDTSITDPGFYPSGEDLPCVERGVALDTAIQLLNFDTINVADLGFPFNIEAIVNWVRVDDIQGLPAGLTWSCSPPNCTFPGGTYGCISITGTTNDVVGEYPLLITATIDADAGSFGNQQIQGTTDDIGYTFILNAIEQGSPCPAPSVDIPGPAYACPGGGAQLSPVVDPGGGSGPYTYSWSPSTDLSDPNILNPIASPSVATTYTLTVTDTNNFSFSSTVEVLIDNSPTPVADFTDSVAGGNSVYFTDLSANATTYHWDFGDGNMSSMQSPNHTYLSLGSYTVTLIASNNCGADTTTMSYDVTSIRDLGLQGIDMEVYPNPTTGIVNINASGLTQGAYKLELHDLTGKLVYTIDRNANELTNTSIDLSDLTKGMYFLSVTGKDRRQVIKLMLDK